MIFFIALSPSVALRYAFTGAPSFTKPSSIRLPINLPGG
jgi:hypothetical protein